MTATFYTPQEVADHFKISRRTVVSKANAGIWPCNRFGAKSLRFTDEHIAQIEALTQSKPKAPVANIHGLITRPRRKL